SPMAPSQDVPDKLYFKIGEAAQLVGVQPHVLRYWEKELPAVRPGKSALRQRRYRRKDVLLFRGVRRLLQDEHMTLAGVGKRISEVGGAFEESASEGNGVIAINDAANAGMPAPIAKNQNNHMEQSRSNEELLPPQLQL